MALPDSVEIALRGDKTVEEARDAVEIIKQDIAELK